MLSSFNAASAPTSPKASVSHLQRSVASTVDSRARPQQHSYNIWLVTGPAGCGKSTVARFLASKLNLPYVEGDEFHPKSNIEKMSAGIPLTDADRWDWLTALREESVRLIADGHNDVVLTCSALKRKYRDVIRVAPYFKSGVNVHFIYLHAPEEVLLQRVAGRQGHYMKPDMVHSQFDILEPPQPDELELDVQTFDVTRPLEDVEADVLEHARSLMEKDSA